MIKAKKILEAFSKRSLNCSLDSNFVKTVKSVCEEGISAVSGEFSGDKKFIKQVEKDVMDLISYATTLEKKKKKKKKKKKCLKILSSTLALHLNSTTTR